MSTNILVEPAAFMFRAKEFLSVQKLKTISIS